MLFYNLLTFVNYKLIIGKVDCELDSIIETQFFKSKRSQNKPKQEGGIT